MTQRFEKIYVSPEFKKLLKLEAAERGCSIINLTEELSRGRKVGKKINSLFDRII